LGLERPEKMPEPQNDPPGDIDPAAAIGDWGQ